MVLASDGQDRAGHTVWGLGEASDGIHGQDHDGLAAAGRHLTLTLILAFFLFIIMNTGNKPTAQAAGADPSR